MILFKQALSTQKLVNHPLNAQMLFHVILENNTFSNVTQKHSINVCIQYYFSIFFNHYLKKIDYFQFYTKHNMHRMESCLCLCLAWPSVCI